MKTLQDLYAENPQDYMAWRDEVKARYPKPESVEAVEQETEV